MGKKLVDALYEVFLLLCKHLNGFSFSVSECLMADHMMLSCLSEHISASWVMLCLWLQVLHPVCHVRNLMLWTAVYLPSSSPTTPSDDSCAPYPVPGGNPEDTPLSR